jgi:uncharacterized membrane protein
MLKRLRECGELQIETYLGNLLRIGVILAAAVVAIGLGLFLLHYGSAIPDYRIFRGEPADLRGVSAIVKEALAFRRRGVIQLGLLLMIATPVARVAFSVLAFACQRDRVYVMVTLLVLGTLLYSMAGGLP